MSIWMDSQTGDGFDVPRDSADEAPESDVDDLLAPVGEGESWTADQGYPDSSLSVRVWLDENRRLTKVRVSNRWRDRARGTSLSSMFDEAFLVANASIGASAATPVAEAGGAGDAELSAASLARSLAQSAEIWAEVERLDRLPAGEEVPSRWVGSQVDGHNRGRTVGVRLSIQGRTEKVAFDEAWLRQARVSQVCEAVMEAHQDAYARFVPPEYVPGDREKLAVRLESLVSGHSEGGAR